MTTKKDLLKMLEDVPDDAPLYIWDEREGWAYPLDDITEGYKDPDSYKFVDESEYQENEKFWSEEHNMINPYHRYKHCYALYSEWCW